MLAILVVADRLITSGVRATRAELEAAEVR